MGVPGIISKDIISVIIKSLDYLPLASTVKSLAHIVHKAFYNPNEEFTSPSHTFKPLIRENKGYSRDIALLVPILGNIVIYLRDTLATIRGNWFYSKLNNISDNSLYIKILKEAASYGNINAMVLLGNQLLDGIRCKIDEKSAIFWYKQAAVKGSPEALNGLGTCHEHGIGYPKNVEKAFDLYSKAAKQGNELATKSIFRLLSSDTTIKKYPHSEDVLRNVAAQGNNRAMEILGDLYSTGLHKDEDQAKAKAAEWYGKAKLNGNKKAGKKLKDIANFFPSMWKARNAAKSLIHDGEAEKLIEEGKKELHPEGMFGISHPNKAVQLFRKAAALGNHKIQMEAGQLLQGEISKRTKDPSYEQEAVTFFLKALEKDPMPAAETLIKCLKEGKGLVKDIKEAEALEKEYEKLHSKLIDILCSSEENLHDPALRNELCQLFGGVLKYCPDFCGLIAKLTEEPYRSKTALRVLRNRYLPGGSKYWSSPIQPQNQKGTTKTKFRDIWQKEKTEAIKSKYEQALYLLERKGTPSSLDRAKSLLEELLWDKRCPNPSKVEELLKKHFPSSPLPQEDPADKLGPSQLCKEIENFRQKVKKCVTIHSLKQKKLALHNG